MGCATFGVSQVLVGLYRVGVVNLRQALEAADATGLDDPARLLDLMVARLRADNFIPESMTAAFRTAVWREYLRHRGEDFSAFYSEVPVGVRARPGPERDQLLELLASVLARLELRPLVSVAEADPGGEEAEVRIGDHTRLRGPFTRPGLEVAVRQSLSDW